jgi:hypothetical protein
MDVESLKPGAAKNIRRIGRTDLPGGGLVTVENGYCYVGHIDPPNGTSILDVSDPKHPRLVSRIEVPEGLHSHKVRVSGDIMLVNYEQYKSPVKPQAGLKIFDISDRSRPREICFFKTPGKGVHRFTFDGRYAYISPTMEGYVGNIVMILDLKNPGKPEEVGRWWVPGQWTAGGETPSWKADDYRCHHPMRKGNRLYVSYWHGGIVILDIADMTKPKLVSHVLTNPPYPSPTHTTLPIPWKIMDRDILVVADEEAQKHRPEPPAFLWIFDITEETRPIPISTYFLPRAATNGGKIGAHQPAEQVYDNRLFVTWFAAGLRMLDISNPYSPQEIGYYVPLPGRDQEVVNSNDVFRAEDGLLFLVDRYDGLEVLEAEI